MNASAMRQDSARHALFRPTFCELACHHDIPAYLIGHMRTQMREIEARNVTAGHVR
jgi:hypothetical protein